MSRTAYRTLVSLATTALAYAPLASHAQLGLQAVLQRTPQAVLANPAVVLDDRLTVQFASYGTSTQLSFRPVDIGEAVDGALVISPAAITAINERPYGRLEIDASSVLVNVRRSWGHFGFHHGVRAFADVESPRAALSLVAEGNRVAIGAPLQVLPQGYFTTWHELGAHYSRALTNRVHIGGRAKILLGASDMRLTGGQRAAVSVGPTDYAIAYDVAAEGRSAGYGFDFGTDSLAAPQLTFGLGAGYGAAFDLGAVVTTDAGVTYGLGVRDLGAIGWTRGRRHSAAGAGVYRGAEGNVFGEDYSFTAVASYDSVRQRLRLATEEASYGRRLPAKLTAHASSTLSDEIEVGGVVTAVFAGETTAVNAGLRAGYHFGERARLGLIVGGGREGFFVGGSVDARIGPVLVFASSDQVLGLFSGYNLRSTHGRLGAAYVLD